MTSSPAQIRVLMFGPALSAQGGIATIERLLLESAPPCVLLRHVPTMRASTRVIKLGMFMGAMSRLTCDCIRGRVDLGHLHLAPRASTIRKGLLGDLMHHLKRPYVIHSNASVLDEWYRARGKFLKGWTRQFFERASRIVVVSESWKRFFVDECRISPDRVDVLFNPIRVPRSIPHRTENNPIHFVYIGAINARKGGLRVIEAFSRLPPTVRRAARITIAGDGEVATARSMVESKSLGGEILISDWLQPADRDNLLASADAYLLPSTNEGLPMGMLEAMSWGVAPIASAAGGTAEVLEHNTNGLIVDPLDIDDISNAMLRFIEDRCLVRRLGSAARVRVQPFDLEPYWNSLVRVYDRALMAHRSA